MNYRSMAEAALNRRERLFTERQRVVADKNLRTDEKRARISVLDSEMDAAAAEAREAVEAGERDQEIRGAFQRSGALGEAALRGGSEPVEGEWRGLLPSHTEIREMAETRTENGTSYLIPSGTARKFVDMLRNKAVFLSGIPSENLIPFNERDWEMPILSASDMPALVAENALITEGNDTWVGLSFTAKKYADYRTVGNETLADSGLNLRNALAQVMIRNLAAEFDTDAFTGAGGTTTPLLGLIGQGVSTPAKRLSLTPES